ncbi:MAG: hypothetical protein ACRCX2_36355 [Paraclostridium sp.]
MSILNELHKAMSAVGLESDNRVENRPYAGHAFESELTEIDEVVSLFDLEGANQGYAILDSAMVLAAGTEEDGSINLGALNSFGLESVVETVKRTGYKAKALAMKMVDALIEFVKKIMNILMNKNLVLKKFGTYIKKYKDKLSNKQIGEKDDEKEVTIRTYKGLGTFLGECVTITKTEIDEEINKIKSAANFTAFMAALKGALERVTQLGKNSFDTIDKVEAILEEKVLEEKYDKMIEGFEYTETETLTIKAAKAAILKAVNETTAHTGKDVKVQAQLRKFVDATKKARDKMVKDSSYTDTEDNMKENMIVQKVASVITRAQSQYTKLFKHATNALNALLADMHKIISA